VLEILVRGERIVRGIGIRKEQFGKPRIYRIHLADPAGPSFSDLLFEQRVQHDRCCSAILEPPNRIEFRRQRRRAGDKRVAQLESHVNDRRI
jgi:hypothetical protein